MLSVVVIGVVVARNIRQEIYPLYQIDTVDISMQYRGQSGRGGAIDYSANRVGIAGMELTRRIEATASEGRASVSVEICLVSIAIEPYRGDCCSGSN